MCLQLFLYKERAPNQCGTSETEEDKRTSIKAVLTEMTFPIIFPPTLIFNLLTVSDSQLYLPNKKGTCRYTTKGLLSSISQLLIAEQGYFCSMHDF